MDTKKLHTEKIKQKALELDFLAVGISKADFLEEESQKLDDWLKKGFHAEMKYMENHFEKRTNPQKLVEGSKSVISVLQNYYPSEKQADDTYQIAKYAYGKDYHFVVKEKLKKLFQFIHEEIAEVNGRVFTDSAPVLEQAWAAKSGLGWIGKNTNIINKKFGSFFFIGELIVDLELEYDKSIKNYCGNCTKCIDACPTNALSPYSLDASKCISYLTIEKRGEIPQEMKKKWDKWIFGCDTCQDVCPWNKNAQPHNEPAFSPSKEILKLSKEDWQQMDKTLFKKLFKNTPLKRTKFEGLKRNIDFLKD